MKEFSGYQSVLERFRERRNPNPIPNRFPWQSRIAMVELTKLAIENLRNNGSETIRVLTSRFPWEVYGKPPLRTELESFLKLGGNLRVLIWTESLDRNELLLQSLQEIAPDDGLNYLVSGTEQGGDELHHMFVVGTSAYRFEAPHPSFKEVEFTELSPEVPARISFNDQENAESLVNYFDRLWRQLDEKVVDAEDDFVSA